MLLRTPQRILAAGVVFNLQEIGMVFLLFYRMIIKKCMVQEIIDRLKGKKTEWILT